MTKLSLQDEREFNQIFTSVGSTPLRATRRNDWFAEKAREVGARRVLEIGCGSGAAAAHIAIKTGLEVVAVDISDKFLDHARTTYSLPNLSFEKLDLLADDLGRFGRFDLVFGNGILHHLVLRLDEVLRALHSLATRAAASPSSSPISSIPIARSFSAHASVGGSRSSNLTKWRSPLANCAGRFP